MSVAAWVDLSAIVLLAAAVPAALAVYAWRARNQVFSEKPGFSPLSLALFGIFVALLVCYPFSVDRRYSAWQILKWAGFVAVYALARLAPRRWVTNGARLLLAVLSLVVIGERISNPDARAGVLLQLNPNIMAAWLIPLFYLADPGLVWGLGVLTAVCVTESRGALVAIVAGVVTKQARQPGRFVAVKWAAIAVALVGLLVACRMSTISNRLETWREAVDLFIQRPIVGWGPGVYETLARNEPRHPHADNLILTTAAEMGLVGLLALGSLAWAGARTVAQSTVPARWGLLAWAVHNLVDCTLWWYWPGITLMVLLAVVTQQKRGIQ